MLFLCFFERKFIINVISGSIQFFFFFLRSLLILDDIWDPWVLKAFDNQCQILLTTRDKSVTDSVMGKYYFLFMMIQLHLNMWHTKLLTMSW